MSNSFILISFSQPSIFSIQILLNTKNGSKRSAFFFRRPNSSGESSDPQSSQSSSSSRVIPGPAGAVESAMHQKNLDRQSLSSQEIPIATQEYIRRAIEDPVKNEAFQDGPWFSAMEFLTEAGTYYPLSSIKKKCHNVDRVDQVVAVIKSCTPNGLGDLWMTLKDPMYTIDAAIHRKVTESKFGKDISFDFVLILQKVVVWAPNPSRSACYLNITLPNVFKVFSKNNEVM